MEGLPLQQPSASLGAGGVRRASSRALRGGFCGSGIPLGRISLSLLRKTNKQYFFFPPMRSVYDCVISFSCSRENVVSLSEDGERLFIKRDGNKAESWSGRLGPFERGQEGQKGRTGRRDRTGRRARRARWASIEFLNWDPPPTPVKPARDPQRKHGSADQKLTTRFSIHSGSVGRAPAWLCLKSLGFTPSKARNLLNGV